MNCQEALSLLHHHLDSLEGLGYAALVGRIGESQAFEKCGESGAAYQIEVSLQWDGNPNGMIRIIGSIDDGGMRALFPLTVSRLIVPEAGKSSSLDNSQHLFDDGDTA